MKASIVNIFTDYRMDDTLWNYYYSSRGINAVVMMKHKYLL